MKWKHSDSNYDKKYKNRNYTERGSLQHKKNKAVQLLKTAQPV